MKWKHFDPVDGLSEEELQKMTSDELKAAEDECMMKNAWKVCEDVCSRIDGEPAPSGDMSSYVTNREGSFVVQYSEGQNEPIIFISKILPSILY